MTSRRNVPAEVVAARRGRGLVPRGFTLVELLIAVLVVFRHRSNLARILAGTEPRIGHSDPDVPEGTGAAPGEG